MALIICSECGKEFSNKAPACPNCGCPTEAITKNNSVQQDSSSIKATLENNPLYSYLTQIFTLESDKYTMSRIILNLQETKRKQFPQDIDIGPMPDIEEIRKAYVDDHMRWYEKSEWEAHERFYRSRASSSDYDVRKAADNVRYSINLERETCLKKWEYSEKGEYVRSSLSICGIKNPFTLKKRLDQGYEKHKHHIDEHNAKVEAHLRAIQAKYDSEVAARKRAIEDNENRERIRFEYREYNAGIDQQIEHIRSEMGKTERTLAALYELNIIYPKYRSIIPVTMFLEYMKSGRRRILEGIDGMYDLYETELLGKQILGELGQINSTLSVISYQIGGIANQLTGIARNQIMIYEEVAKGNEIAKKLSETTSNILEKTASMVSTTGEIRKGLSAVQASSEVIAYNSEITAHRTEAIAKIQEYEFSLRHPNFPSV